VASHLDISFAVCRASVCACDGKSIADQDVGRIVRTTNQGIPTFRIQSFGGYLDLGAGRVEGLRQAVGQREAHGGSAAILAAALVGQADLGIEVVEVSIDGAWANHQPLSDLRIRQAGGHQP